MCNDFQRTALFLKGVDFSERFAKKDFRIYKGIVNNFFLR